MASTSKSDIENTEMVIDLDKSISDSHLTVASMEIMKGHYNKKLMEHYTSLNAGLSSKTLLTENLVSQRSLYNFKKEIKSGKKNPLYKIGLMNEKKFLFVHSTKGKFKAIIPIEEWFDIGWQMHNKYGHPDSNTLNSLMRLKYLVNDYAVDLIKEVCVICLGEDKPYYRCALDLVPMVHYKNFAFTHLMVFEDLFSGHVHLRPLSLDFMQTEICLELLAIFMDFGPPRKLFISKHIFDLSLTQVQQLTSFAPFDLDIEIIEPNPERIDRVKNALLNWMRDNKSSNWAIGCYALQWDMNNENFDPEEKTPFTKVFRSLDKCTVPDLTEMEIGRFELPRSCSTKESIIINDLLEDDPLEDTADDNALAKDSTEPPQIEISSEDEPSVENTEDSPVQKGAKQDDSLKFSRVESPSIQSAFIVESSDPNSTAVKEEAVHLNKDIRTSASEEMDVEDPLKVCEETPKTCVSCSENVLIAVKCVNCNKYVHLECGERTNDGQDIKCSICVKLDLVFG